MRLSLSDKDLDKIIQEGLDEIDQETKTDEEIRERARFLTRDLMQGHNVKTSGFPDGSVWTIGSRTRKFFDKDGVEHHTVVLLCYNDARLKIHGPMYKPMMLEAEIDENYDMEQALEAAVTMFVAKQFGKMIVEQLDD